jgi:hypothetical protein
MLREEAFVLHHVSTAITDDAAEGSGNLELFFGVCLKGVAFDEACVWRHCEVGERGEAFSGWTSRGVAG